MGVDLDHSKKEIPMPKYNPQSTLEKIKIAGKIAAKDDDFRQALNKWKICTEGLSDEVLHSWKLKIRVAIQKEAEFGKIHDTYEDEFIRTEGGMDVSCQFSM